MTENDSKLPAKRPLKVVLVCHSDLLGGASIVTYRLMNALRDGWLLEENQETWNEVPCLRVAVDQTGTRNGRIVSTVWLRQDGGTPLRGEVAVDGETILTADFTSFTFYDTLEEDSP